MVTKQRHNERGAGVKVRAPRRVGFGDKLGRFDFKVSPYLYISPFFLVFAVVGLFPLLYTAFISFMDWDLVRNSGEFIGFGQYAYVLGQPKFWLALRNTFSIFLLSSVPQLIAAIFIAAMLDTNLRAKTFWRMGVLVPYVMAPVAVALIFSNMFSDDYGLVNNALGWIGIAPIKWHVSTFWSHVAIATMVNFRWTGYNTLILLAAMQAVPRDMYEAATVDGAGKVRQFFSITIPSLKPTLIFVIITSTIGGLQIFDEPKMYDRTGRGGANGQWLTLSLYLYQTGWGEWNFGRAAAIAWLLFILILIIGVINLVATRTVVADAASQDRKTRKRMRVNAKRAAAEVKAQRKQEEAERARLTANGSVEAPSAGRRTGTEQ